MPARSTAASTKTSAAELQARLKPLIRKTQPYAKKIAHRAVWVEPQLLAEIKYRAKSAEGKVRHPFFKGIRRIFNEGGLGLRKRRDGENVFAVHDPEGLSLRGVAN